jgi:pimeloyl-ACP methyl ester carboxylesterase
MKKSIRLLLLLMVGITTCASAGQPLWETLPPAAALPPLSNQGHVTRGGASIWYGVIGKGAPVLLLHGGMASSDSWGEQVPALVKAGYRVILIDTRGHGRSTLGNQPLSYELFADDVIAVMDALQLRQADIVGWSDGGNTALVMAIKSPARIRKLYAFGANMNADAIQPGAFKAPILGQVVTRLQATYARVSPTPTDFGALHTAIEAMQKTEPNYSAAALAAIRGPTIAIVDAEHEEFIKPEHTAYLARTIPGATLTILPGVSHFAPWQAPDQFNRSMLGFLAK